MIVFPMAGLSRRFSEQGYDKPKFMLPLWGYTVFDYAVSSFQHSFGSTPFLFIFRETGGVRSFIETRAAALGIAKPYLVELDKTTAGQAETVEFGIDAVDIAPNGSLTIFNIDSFRLPPSGAVQDRSAWAGYLEVFRGSGDNWSFVKPADETGLAAATAEKQPISNLCCTGLYHFASPQLFRWALEQERAAPSASELYVAPIYNHLIRRGERIGFHVINRNDVVFCGIPSEYEALVGNSPPYALSESGTERSTSRAPLRLIVDLDGTLTVDDGEIPYAEKKPRTDVITKVNALHARGATVIIHSARNMRSYGGNIGMINKHTLPIVLAWLDRNGVCFDEVHMGKPWCGEHGFYVHSRSLRPDAFAALSVDDIERYYTVMLPKPPEGVENG